MPNNVGRRGWYSGVLDETKRIVREFRVRSFFCSVAAVKVYNGSLISLNTGQRSPTK